MKQQYLLTERGKLLIATLIVLFLIVPSIIIVIYTSMRETPADEAGNNGVVSQSGGGSVSSDGDNEQANLDSSLAGTTAFDLVAGTMTFLFTPDLQTTLDVYTMTRLGELLTSPKYTNNTKIAVEIPQLPDEKAIILTTAITNAFTTYEIPLSDVVFFIYQPEKDSRTFEVNVSID